MVETFTTESNLNERNYLELIVPYVDALQSALYRMEALEREYVHTYQNDPVHHIQSRIKTKKSIEGKLHHLQMDSTIENAKNYLTDIAGIRIVCHFIQEIDRMVEMIRRQTDWIVIKERDYIRNPKDNGYRSYHIVFSVPVYHDGGMEYYPVEIQLRTPAMDLWASMEHRICYKSENGGPRMQEVVSEEFLGYARQLQEMEARMEKYCDAV